MAEFYGFDRNTAARLIRQMQRMEREIKVLRQQVANNHAATPGSRPRQLRTGMTTTNDAHSVYPGVTGNTFVVRLQTWTFTETPGAQSVTRVNWDRYVIARTEDGSFIPENTYVQVYRQEGRGGRRWWIAKNAVKSDIIGEITNELKCEVGSVAITEDTAYETLTGNDSSVTSAWNEFAIPALAGDMGLFGWDERYDRYFLKQVFHRCVTAVADVWDTAPCFNKVGVCFGAPGAHLPVAEETEGCKVWDWTTCDSSSGGEICNPVWPGDTQCNQCPPSSSGA